MTKNYFSVRKHTENAKQKQKEHTVVAWKYFPRLGSTAITASGPEITWVGVLFIETVVEPS